jgi:hypothetical protein
MHSEICIVRSELKSRVSGFALSSSAREICFRNKLRVGFTFLATAPACTGQPHVLIFPLTKKFLTPQAAPVYYFDFVTKTEQTALPFFISFSSGSTAKIFSDGTPEAETGSLAVIPVWGKHHVTT